MSNLELLTAAIEKGIINIDSINRELEMTKESEILKKHPFKIWQGRNGDWFTYLVEDGVRKLKKRKTKKGIERAIIDHHNYLEDKASRTFRKEFQTWIAKKKEWAELDESTIMRYESDFNRFFPEGSKFAELNVADIDDEILEDFIKKTIADNGLTAKCYQNLKIIINGTLKFAKKQKHTGFSVGTFFRDLDLSDRIFRRASDQSKIIFSKDDRKTLYDYLISHPDPYNLALALQCLTGMRIGELADVKKEDNVEDCKLSIHRTETKCRGAAGQDTVTVKEEAKMGHNGVILLPRAAQEIIDKAAKISKGQEYLFSTDKGRITARQLNYRLRKACKEAGIDYRSSHKMRKTYASILLSSNVDETIVQAQMRHRQIATTRTYYYFNIESVENEKRIIENVASL